MSTFKHHLLCRALGWVQMLTLGLGGLAPAHAIIIQAGADPEATAALQARAHKMGARHTCVVGILCTDTHEAQTTATGVYLGLSDDGKKGLVLTAGHTGDKLPKPLKEIVISFGPAMRSEEAINIFANRKVVHPADPHAPGASKDLAILEFDAAIGGEALEKMGVKPAVLYQGTGYRKPLLEGEIAGFGLFGTHASPVSHRLFTIHGGKTRVTFEEWMGRTGFLHMSRVSDQLVKSGAAKGGHPNRLQFAMTHEESEVRHLDGARPLRFRSHPDQALITEGDSGGPLFFNTKEGLKVAGIASRVGIEPLAWSGGEDLFIHQFWEPVMDAVKWIAAVKAGATDTSRIIEPGTAKAEAAPALSAPEAREEKKAGSDLF